MAWYWIVCITFAYFLLGAVIGEIWDAIEGCDESFKITSMLIWPLIIVVGIALGLLYLTQELGKLIFNVTMARIEDIGNFIYIQRQKRHQRKAQKALRPKNKKGYSKEEIDDIDYDG